ncbi:MAG TPA: hypothetical protein DDY78_11695, partial [Planctomycetales bacterium]|nr:hypothetical protein [Planctomycetales bacterium]
MKVLNFGDAASVAVSDFMSHALVHLDGMVTTTAGDVTAAAQSVNATNATSSTALVLCHAWIDRWHGLPAR